METKIILKRKYIYILLILVLSTIFINKLSSREEDLNLDLTISYKETTPKREVVWDDLTTQELTDKLNKNLYSTLEGTGHYFANYTKETGLDPYLAVSIINLETGCKWGCSSLVKKCNNIGGIKGKPSCNGSSYRSYSSLEEGINGYLDLVYYNYYSKGLDTPEKMNTKYAESKTWAQKVNAYYETIKSS